MAVAWLHVFTWLTANMTPPTVPENELSKCLFRLKLNVAYVSESFFKTFWSSLS